MSPEQQRLVRKIFDKLINLPEQDRLTYVRGACAGQPEVFAEVIRILDEQEQTGSPRPYEPPAPASAAAGSKRVGRYLIEEKLGSGAMGSVYSALDPKIGRRVALKTINPQAINDASDDDFLRDRLLREARSAGALSHAGIVTVYDVDEADGIAFIAMERVEGQSLLDILSKQGRFPLRAVLDILRQTAAALDYAHSKGVVHRDIKPGNIMLQENGIVKIADFGIAKFKSAGLAATSSSLIMGSPMYMSPEQIKALPLDGRSDQFSLAVLAYELLTGAVPFREQTALGLSLAITGGERPSIQAADPSLPASLDGPLHRALAIHNDDRFPSCLAFVEALERSASLEPRRETASATPPPLPARRKARSIWVALLCLGAAVFAVIGAVLVYKHSLQPAPQPRIKPMIVRFVAEPAVVKPGERAALRWEVSDAASVVIDQGIGRVAATGSIEIGPSATTRYTLKASGAGGDEAGSVVVEVGPAPPPAHELTRAAPKILEFRAEPKGTDAFHLAWNVDGASRVSIQPGIGAVRPHGSLDRSVEKDTTFTLAATSDAGTRVTSSLTIAVRAKPVEAARTVKSEAVVSEIKQPETNKLTLVSMQPPAITPKQMRQYKLSGSGFSLKSTIHLDVPGFVGSRQDKLPDARPSETSSDGTWMKICIYMDSQTTGNTLRLSARNPGSKDASLEVPVQR